MRTPQPVLRRKPKDFAHVIEVNFISTNHQNNSTLSTQIHSYVLSNNLWMWQTMEQRCQRGHQHICRNSDEATRRRSIRDCVALLYYSLLLLLNVGLHNLLSNDDELLHPNFDRNVNL